MPSLISATAADTLDDEKKPTIERSIIPTCSNPSVEYVESFDDSSSSPKSLRILKPGSSFRNSPTKQQTSSVITNTPFSLASLLGAAAGENDIQIKRLLPIVIPSQQQATQKPNPLADDGLAASFACPQVSTPDKATLKDSTIFGSIPTKKFKLSTHFHPSTATEGQLSLSDQEAIQKQQMKQMTDKVLKIDEESEHFKTNSKVVLMPTTLSLSDDKNPATQPLCSIEKISNSSSSGGQINPMKEPSRPESSQTSSQQLMNGCQSQNNALLIFNKIQTAPEIQTKLLWEMFDLISFGVLEDDKIELILEDAMITENRVPRYSFYIYSKEAAQKVGHLSLRTKTTYEEEQLWGNLGFTIWPEFRGHKYALKASRVAIQFAKQCDMTRIYLTANPNNKASIKTIQNLGAKYIETSIVPHDSSLYEVEKCENNARFYLTL